jgi:mRNA interferase MazF
VGPELIVIRSVLDIAYNFGDIVLIGFPHTDLQGVSKRPAIVLYDSGDQDVLVARVTTQEYRTEADYEIRE